MLPQQANNTMPPCPALFIAAPASGQGKTSLTAALAYYHRQQGRHVRVFKTGPDFLDPMILQQASGHPVLPLDLWMVGAEACRAKLHAAARQADLILVEGVMGLFDGEPSAADLAQQFSLPVAVLIDASRMGQTFAALALGLASYRPDLPLAGFIANRVGSERHAQMLTAGLTDQTPLLATLPRFAATLPARHLGLVQAEEIADLETRLQAMAEPIGATALAELPAPVAFAPPEPAAEPLPRWLAGQHIAVARDAAFAFVYQDNFTCLEALGARLSFFSPLADRTVQADAIYLPGGYPELHLQTLAANQALQAALRTHVEAGKPLYAECGGMLYLLEQLTDQAGHTAALAGLLPGRAQLQPQVAGIGMQSLALPEGTLRGHSFHHSRLQTPLQPVQHCLRQSSDRPGEAFYRLGAIRASYLHGYFPSAPRAAASLFLP